MEPLAGGIPQVGGQVKIVVGGHGVNVAQISRQVREFCLDFNSLLIPPVQGCHSKAVPQVVNAWWTAFFI